MNAPLALAPGLQAQVALLRQRLQSGAPPGPMPPLPHDLEAVFGLTRFEAEILLLCAAVEVDPGFPDILAQLAGGQRVPSFGLALNHLAEPDWAAITPGAPLRYWRLVEMQPGEALLQCRLRIDETVLHHLFGVPGPDERLQGLLRPLDLPAILAPSQAMLADEAAALLARPDPPLIQLIGPQGAGQAEIAATACASVGLVLERLAAHNLPAASGEREELRRLWRRHALLAGAALLIELDGAEDTEPRLRAFLAGLDGPVLLAAAAPVAVSEATVKLEVARPTPMEQAGLWQTALSEAVPAAVLESLVGHFDLGPTAIATIGANAAARHAKGVDAGTIDGGALRRACRLHARNRLDDLATRVEPRAGWADLVVPPAVTAQLQAIISQSEGRMQVYERWGFGARFQRGLGVSAMFCGPSGTGKTLAAEVLAGVLELDLFRVDLSRVVSKYIGETERNLRRIFEAAEAGHAVLLFDEADALFGKRTEVKDSHDRYANIEVSYLLQRMEEYRGLAVLTTNMRDAIDIAFMRRLRFVVDFPFPDPAERARIWERMFPEAAPTEGLDLARLAQLNVAGGHIRNIALGAAFLAAGRGTPIGMPHVLEAARHEYAKFDRPLTQAELAQW